jgi:glycosyltransferase involved in cell wall biosynthesis
MVPERRADTLAPVRALVVTNMYPTDERPALGSFVRDQVQALRRIEGVTVELCAFEPGSVTGYLQAARDLRRRFKHEHFDVVHAHFGLTAWPALALRAPMHAVTLHGTDLAHPRSRAVTLASLRLLDLVAVVSEPLASSVPRWAMRGRPAVLPCGVDLGRFHAIPRPEARAELGLDPAGRYLLFPADPARPEKRYDRAAAVAGDAPLLTLGNVAPERVPLLVNAANAVLVPSEREGFGLAVLEALACDVPVLATDVGIAPQALDGVEGAYCGPFEQVAWSRALTPHLTDPDPRIAGRAHAEAFSTDRMAANVVSAWRALVPAASGR